MVMLGIFDERGGLQTIPLFYCCALSCVCVMLLLSLEKTSSQEVARWSAPGRA